MEILEGHNKFYVNDAQGNQVAEVVEKMRQEQRKIIPLCPFAKHEFDNTREYDDIRA